MHDRQRLGGPFSGRPRTNRETLLRTLCTGLIAIAAALSLSAPFFAGCGGGGGGGDGAPFGLTSREVVASLAFSTGSPQPENVTIERAYPELSFSSPVFVTAAPGDDTRLFVVEKGGTIRVFDADDATETSTVFLDIDVRSGGEQGLLGLAFSPDYATDGEFYVSYIAGSGLRRTVISRFQVDPDDPESADATSEEVLLEVGQPFTNHNGGMIAFGSDGYLYISIGDGGSADDPFANGQDRTTLLGTIVRIDVTATEGTLAYAIPDDNPFVGEGGGVREEIYAYGLRNPWRFSFDRDTDELGVGDVEQGDREEISLVNSGDNLGWRIYEGSLSFINPSGLPASDFVEPVYDYDRTNGASITGGYVYRGSAVPSLAGVYVYGDYVSNRVWGLVTTDDEVVSNVQIGTISNIASFGEDADGELIAVSLNGSLWRFEEGDGPPPADAPPPPSFLSETGIFSSLSPAAPLEPARGVIEYDVAYPEWADGAALRRFVFLPGTSQIDFDATGGWQFPVGTVIAKHFEIDLDETDDTDAPLRLETRVMVREINSWSFYLYRWNAAGDDAELLSGSAEEPLTIETADGPDNFSWHFPSAAECAGCHGGEEGVVLGIRTRQLNSDFDYPTLTGSDPITDNQLRSWNNIRLFTTNILPGGDATAAYESYPDPLSEEPEDAAAIARAYLAVNCASCHQPGGSAPGSLDLRYDTADADLGAIDVPPAAGDLGIPDARLITPGDRNASVLHERLLRLDSERMPPPSRRIDPDGPEAVGAWIDALQSD